VNVPLNPARIYPRSRLCTSFSIKFAARLFSFSLVLVSGYGYAACEQEAASLCSDGNPRCLQDAAKSVEQAADDCRTPEGRQQNASLWEATPSFFDNAPHEHVFWRCVARQCDGSQPPEK
jgi:hypothetical protein